MSDANNSSKIIVGANGTIYVAPIGSTAPTNATSTPDAAFKPLGFITEAGATITPGQTVVDVKVWQSEYPARRIISERMLDADFILREFNDETLVFAMGGGTLANVGGGVFKFTPPTPEAVDKRAFILDWRDGTKHYRLYIPNGQVINLGNFTLSRTAAAELPVKFAVNSDGLSDPFNIFSDDAGLGS